VATMRLRTLLWQSITAASKTYRGKAKAPQASSNTSTAQGTNGAQQRERLST